MFSFSEREREREKERKRDGIYLAYMHLKLLRGFFKLCLHNSKIDLNLCLSTERHYFHLKFQNIKFK